MKYITFDKVVKILKVGDFVGNRQRVLKVTAVGNANVIGVDIAGIEHTLRFSNMDRHNNVLIFEKLQRK
jgi:hypothetical protein